MQNWAPRVLRAIALVLVPLLLIEVFGQPRGLRAQALSPEQELALEIFRERRARRATSVLRRC